MDDTGDTLLLVCSRENSIDRIKKRKVVRKNANVEPDRNSNAEGKSTHKDNFMSDDDSVEMSTANVNSNKNLQQFRYDKDHQGPYIVYIDSYDESGMRKCLNGVSVSRFLIQLGIKGIREVTKKGYGRCKVVCNSFETANRLAEDSRLPQNGLSPKIFAHFVSKVGIIFDIPTDMSEDEFMLTEM